MTTTMIHHDERKENDNGLQGQESGQDEGLYGRAAGTPRGWAVAAAVHGGSSSRARGQNPEMKRGLCTRGSRSIEASTGDYQRSALGEPSTRAATRGTRTKAMGCRIGRPWRRRPWLPRCSRRTDARTHDVDEEPSAAGAEQRSHRGAAEEGRLRKEERQKGRPGATGWAAAANERWAHHAERHGGLSVVRVSRPRRTASGKTVILNFAGGRKRKTVSWGGSRGRAPPTQVPAGARPPSAGPGARAVVCWPRSLRQERGWIREDERRKKMTCWTRNALRAQGQAGVTGRHVNAEKTRSV